MLLVRGLAKVGGGGGMIVVQRRDGGQAGDRLTRLHFFFFCGMRGAMYVHTDCFDIIPVYQNHIMHASSAAGLFS